MEWVKPEIKREDVEGGAGDVAGEAGRTTTAGGDDEGEAGREIKRARTNGASADVAFKVKSEDGMDIEFGNVAKAFGDGAEGSDALATFESLWAEDPDKVSPYCVSASSLLMRVCCAQKSRDPGRNLRYLCSYRQFQK